MICNGGKRTAYFGARGRKNDAGLNAILAGTLPGVAWISGETAPLLFTGFGNPFWSSNLNGPLANVPKVIFDFTDAPHEHWQRLAWAGALVLTGFVLMLNILVRILARKGRKK